MRRRRRQPPARVGIGRALIRYTPRTRQILTEIAESAVSATLERQAQRISATESPTILEAPRRRDGRVPIRLIRAGWSLNGNYYPADVLRRDGPTAWPKGTLCYIDHATDDEDAARPAGSIKNLAAVLTEDARWSDTERGLVAEVRLFTLWRDAIEDMRGVIGMSIRAWVHGEQGEAEGRHGFIVSGIPEGRSVDFVTAPAAGGGILSSALESVRVRADEARNVGGWLESRLHLYLTQLADDLYGQGLLTRAERLTLSSAIGDGLAAYTTRIEADQPQLYQRDLGDGPAAAEPAVESTVGSTSPTAEAAGDHGTGGAPPAAPNPPTRGEPGMSGTHTGEGAPGEAGTATMEAHTPTTEAPAEARLAIIEAERDRERTRAQSLGEALTEAQTEARRASAEAQEAIAEMRRLRANETARSTISLLLTADESGVPADMQPLIGPRVHSQILDHVPLSDDGTVDQVALEAAVTAAIRAERVHAASLLEAQGVGRVAGLGAAGDPTMQMSREQLESSLSEVFQAIGMSDNVAALAAKGR